MASIESFAAGIVGIYIHSLMTLRLEAKSRWDNDSTTIISERIYTKIAG